MTDRSFVLRAPPAAWRTATLLGLLAALTFFAGLGRPALSDSDEAYYAEAAREMRQSGDWLTPTYNYEPRLQKPILFYWLVAAAYGLAGVSAGAARLPAALSGLCLGLLTAAVARRWYGERTARDAGAIVLTAFGYFAIGRQSLPDLPLAFLVTLTTWAFFCAADAHRGRWLSVAALAGGLGLLAKGPIAVVLPALVLLPAAWLDPRLRGIRRGPAALTAAAAVMLALPWYAAMARAHGTSYLSAFFIGDNLERFATTRFNDPRPLWFYLPILAGGLLPWTPLAACLVPRARRWRTSLGARGPALRLVLWTALPFLLFTISIGKQPRYILPVLPPLAILLARALSPGDAASARLLRGSSLLAGAFLCGIAWLLFRAAPAIVGVPAWCAEAAALAAGCAGALLAAGALGLPVRHVPAALACAGAITLGALAVAMSPGGADPVQVMAAAVRAHRTAAEPVGTYRVFVRNLLFYTGARQTNLDDERAAIAFLRRPERVLCVIGHDDLRRLQQTAGVQARVLARVAYLDASPVRLRPLFSADPGRDVEQVLLVTNSVGPDLSEAPVTAEKSSRD